MNSAIADPVAADLPRARIFGAALLLVAEFGVLGAIFKHAIDFECRANWPSAFCEGANAALVSGYCVTGALALYVMMVPGALGHLAVARAPRLRPMALNAAGLALALAPVTFLREGTGTAWLGASLAIWTLAVPLILAGPALALAPMERWRGFFSGHGVAMGACLAAGVIMPALAVRFQPLWTLDWLTGGTFAVVAFLLEAAGYAVQSDAHTKIIGAGDFFVGVGRHCSGIEGIALVALFVTLYLALFRRELRFPLALLLYPLGLAASVGFNVLRISVLLMIGIEGHPDLAVGGFHSHAGWLMFTIVTLGIIAVAQTVPALWRRPSMQGVKLTSSGAVISEQPPFWSDPVVAQILPFAVFMFTALIASTLSQTPGLVYPLRVILVGAAVLAFLPVLARLQWSLDPVAATAGAMVSVVWIAIPVSVGDQPPPYGSLEGELLTLWFVFRAIGTIVLVPLVEESFFRGYLERRLRIHEGVVWIVTAALVTASLFALLHDRWAEAFVASLVFSFVALRRGQVTDAILAHAVANAIIFAWALGTDRIYIV